MSTLGQRFTLVFNGEVYNYRELAKRYLSQIKLRSGSDTEVLLQLLALYGVQSLPWLRGMFAFALWDAIERQLFLARDPFGKKPLYYYQRGNLFCFASEVKALLVHPAVPRRADRTALSKYFLYEYVPAPATGFQDIRQLPAGSWLTVQETGMQQERWWQPRFLPKRDVPLEQATKELDGHLQTAVERRLVADVPVGLFLSGGLDSTTLLWYVRQLVKSPLHTFSVGFAERSFNESHFARMAAEAFGTVHHHVPFSLATFHSTVQLLQDNLDVPLADASLLPMYVVSQAAREHITVGLDGDGSDELFGGYGTFQAAQVAAKLRWLPKNIIYALQSTARFLPTRHRYFSADFKIKSFVRGLGYPLPYQNQIWLGSFSDQELPLLLQAGLPEVTNVFEDIDAVVADAQLLGITDMVSLFTLEHYLQNDILVKLDRASMAFGLEARTPFLDVDVAEFALKLPVAFKRDKRILRYLMRSRLPKAILDRPKQGFAIPLGMWLRGPLKSWAEGVLKPQKLAADGVLKPDFVSRLWQEHQAGKADWRKQLWTLIVFQLWYDQWIEGRAMEKS
jgi:asparagine synthase (glutamine-hydrolysing)